MNSVTRVALAVALASACSSDSLAHRSRPPPSAPRGGPFQSGDSRDLSISYVAVARPIIPKLVVDAYGDPWNYVDRDERIDAIWGEAGAARLRAIVADDGTPLKARLVACEGLFKRD
jgi:hypothetical protein